MIESAKDAQGTGQPGQTVSILAADLFSPQFLLSYARQREREEMFSSLANLAPSFESKQTEDRPVFEFPADQFIFLVK